MAGWLVGCRKRAIFIDNLVSGGGQVAVVADKAKGIARIKRSIGNYVGAR